MFLNVKCLKKLQTIHFKPFMIVIWLFQAKKSYKQIDFDLK